MTLVLCMRCGERIDDDPKRCTCRRSRTRAFLVQPRRPPEPPTALSNFARVALTAAALEPRTEDEMADALAVAARAHRELN